MILVGVAAVGVNPVLFPDRLPPGVPREAVRRLEDPASSARDGLHPRWRQSFVTRCDPDPPATSSGIVVYRTLFGVEVGRDRIGGTQQFDLHPWRWFAAWVAALAIEGSLAVLVLRGGSPVRLGSSGGHRDMRELTCVTLAPAALLAGCGEVRAPWPQGEPSPRPTLSASAPGLPTRFHQTGGLDGRRMNLSVYEDSSARLYGVYGGDREVSVEFRLAASELGRVRKLFESEAWRAVSPGSCCPTRQGADGTYLAVESGGREVGIVEGAPSNPQVLDDASALYGELVTLGFQRRPTPTAEVP